MRTYNGDECTRQPRSSHEASMWYDQIDIQDASKDIREYKAIPLE